MRLILKLLVGVILALLVVVAAGLLYLNAAFPKVNSAPNLKVEATPERLARGKYLFNNLANCITCHSTRDESHYGMPIIPGTEGKGGEVFPPEEGVPGTLYARNITPYGLGDWTDGEIYRALTSGVDKHGKALFPLMPYKNYAQLSKEDIYSIIAHTRTLPSIKNDVPERKLDFPVNLIVKTMPHDSVQPEKAPLPADGLAYGKYVITAASCAECHSPRDGKGVVLPGMDYAGGNNFLLPGGGMIHSVNITPDKETGIGGWSKEQFIENIRAGVKSQETVVAHGQFNTVMPRTQFAGLTDNDLGAIYDYLRSVPAVKNRVDRFTPAKQ